jgi:hypothetical protein
MLLANAARDDHIWNFNAPCSLARERALNCKFAVLVEVSHADARARVYLESISNLPNHMFLFVGSLSSTADAKKARARCVTPWRNA